MQPKRGECLDARVPGNTLFFAVATVLAAYQILGRQRPNGFQHLDLLVAERFATGVDRRLHRQERYDLEQVILHDVANRTDFLVELPATYDAEFLSHRDLHAGDEVAIPHRLEEGVGETEEQQIL